MIRIVEFETRYPLGKDPIDWVLIAPKGEAFLKTQTWHRVAKLNPENFPPHKQSGLSFEDAQAKWSVIGPAYDAWKAGTDLPETGTPLVVWPALDKEQVKVLQGLDVRTVEDVRDMGDNTISKLRFPNARRLPELAADFLKGTDSAAKDQELADLRNQVEAMKEIIEENMAEKQASKKPGRPPKAETEDA